MRTVFENYRLWKIANPIMTEDVLVQLPSWLKEELFVELLKKRFPTYRSIKSFKPVAGLKPGENYSTIMLRLHFEVELEDDTIENISYMLKTPHDFEMYREILKTNNMFTVERDVFLNVKPELEEMYKDVGLDVIFGATAYEIDALDDYVLLEDLRPSGFVNVDRLEGLDKAHVLSVLKKLAQWHAVTAARIHFKGFYKQNYFQPDYTECMRSAIEQTAETLGKSLMKCLPLYDNFESYSEAVKQIHPKLVDLIYGLGHPDPTDFNALCHGDLWTNNILFQHKEESSDPTQTYFVDLQLPRYCSVAFDLLYFLLSSTQFDIKLSLFDYFIKYYHDQLEEHLKLLKYPEEKIPTLRGLHQQLFKHGFVGYQVVIMLCPPLLLDQTDNANLTDFITESKDGDDLKLQMFTNARYRKHVSAILSWMLNRGALQY